MNGGAGTGAARAGSTAAVVVNGGAGTGAVLAGSATAAVVNGGGAETGAALAGSAAAAVVNSGAETGAALAGSAAAAVVNGGADTGAALAGSAAAAIVNGGAETGVVLAGSAMLETEASALGESFQDRSTLNPTPRAREKKIVRTIPSGAPAASRKVLAHAIFLFVIPTTTGSVLSLGFSVLIIAKWAFLIARTFLFEMTAPATAAIALTAAIIAASIVMDFFLRIFSV
jgi:hypothetical protein